MTEQVRPLEITTEEPDVEEVPGQNEADPSAEESVDGEAGVSGEKKLWKRVQRQRSKTSL